MTTDATQCTSALVTQADREAAATYWQTFVARPGKCIVGNQIRKGGLDELESVQAFARHREATTATLTAQVEALTAERDSLREWYTIIEAELTATEKEVSRLQIALARYGDRVRMASAPAELQETIDTALATVAAFASTREGDVA